MDTDLRRLLASLDYRFSLASKDAPEGFAWFSAGAGVRTPLELVSHLCDLTDMMLEQFGVESNGKNRHDDFDLASAQFRSKLRRLDSLLADGVPFCPVRPGLHYSGLLQGPVSDALTHIGQLATLRRLAGSPIERVRYWQVEMPHPAEREE